MVTFRVCAVQQGESRHFLHWKNPDGPFHGQNVGFFAVDSDGTSLFDDNYQFSVGKNLVNSRDAYGLLPVATEILRSVLREGDTFTRTHPFTSRTERCLRWCTSPMWCRLMDTWFVGARMPAVSRYLPVAVKKRDTVLRTVQSAADLTLAQGRDAGLRELMNSSVSLQPEDVGVFALDYQGTILADSRNPGMIGRDAFFCTDPHGASSLRELVMVAREGGGYAYVGIEDTDRHEYLICLAYVEPMGDDWCLGGIILLNRVPA